VLISSDRAESKLSDIDLIIIEGLNNLYNVNFPAAKQKFREAQEKYPQELKGIYYESLMSFYESVVMQTDEKYDEFLEKSDKVLDRCELELDKNEKNIEALYMRGQTYSYRSLLMLILNKNLIRAASNGNDGYKTLSKVVELDPGYYDAYMGLGLFKIAIGYVPDKFKWLLEIIGFKGSISDGREYLKIAMNNGKLTKVEAKAYLTIFSMRERDLFNMEARQYAQALAEQYPNSPFFNALYGVILIQGGLTANAIEYFQKALNQNSYDMTKYMRKTTLSLLGNAYFSLNDFPNAIKCLEEFTTLTGEKDKYNISLFTLGVSHEMTGNRSKAIKYYNSVRPDFIKEKDGETEKLFYRLSKERVNKPISKLDSLNIIAMNFKDSRQYENSKNIYEYLENSGNLNSFDNDGLVRYYYEYGRLMVEMKNIPKAIELFNKAVLTKPKSEIWLIPHSYFELAKIYHRQGSYSMSKKMFEKINEYKDYDLEQFLGMRITNFLKNN
jgi:tetratricopeptide (TPR) repeat protein